MPSPVGWGATCVGGFPDLSKVALERQRNPTNDLKKHKISQLQNFNLILQLVLGYGAI
ncbi:hypothetical protein IQ259_24530 [Fortiea sp. LEGE XX443]|uniref:hypothetical protein n=1 Tax=Fortiea sp. LEGE XX443 TaxID=1828611 RepID=UPI001882E2C6|nr:hypothetical protein [Fortiea sp. LEGE XX443]MBE9008140.1 hypothetical protein [Fortiea sp. LEGE XX443]